MVEILILSGAGERKLGKRPAAAYNPEYVHHITSQLTLLSDKPLKGRGRENEDRYIRLKPHSL